MNHLKLYENQDIDVTSFAGYLREMFFSDVEISHCATAPYGENQARIVFELQQLTEHSMRKSLEMLEYLKNIVDVDRFLVTRNDYKGGLSINFYVSKISLFEYFDTVKYNL